MAYDKQALRRFAAQIRIEAIRAMAGFGAGHIGGSMSAADVLAALYGQVMRIRPSEPLWPERDRFVMSKGHCGPALYAALALKGFFPMEWLQTMNRLDTRLPSHCDRRLTPGIDMSTGSLGQGASVAAGLALALRMKGCASRVFALLGDGELQEGQVWEAAQFAAHRGLGNLIFLIDQNGAQLDGTTQEVCNPFSVREKMQSFGWDARETAGDDPSAIVEALEQMADPDKPHVLILNTRKGIGCSFAERERLNHHMSITQDMAQEAIAEIERRLAQGLRPGGEAPWQD